jgi:choline dehydrogenase-like flavoprotein
MAGRRFGHVVVIGAGMAGLLTARAMADHADRVTILERDRIPATPVPRPGVPQAHHTHVLLSAGQQTLEAMLPGVLAELASLGVPAVGLPRDLVQLNGGQWMPRWRDSRDLLTGTRALLEHVVRRRVLGSGDIQIQESVEVTGLVGDAQRVHGVQLRDRGAGGERTLDADLVVDGPVDRIAGWYLGQLQRMLPSNRLIGNAFLEVIHLVAPARSLFAPRVARAVLFGRSTPELPGPRCSPSRETAWAPVNTEAHARQRATSRAGWRDDDRAPAHRWS